MYSFINFDHRLKVGICPFLNSPLPEVIIALIWFIIV